ncbi:MAG: helix-turn-helix transcriptional regulator [Cyanobacteria bacterium P01_E01_bin.42]
MIEAQMPTRNTIKELLEEKGDTPYRFWKKTGLSQNTAYRLHDDPSYIPGGDVMAKIFEAYGWQPGDYLFCSKPSGDETKQPLIS